MVAREKDVRPRATSRYSSREVARALVSSGNDDGIEAVWKEYQEKPRMERGAVQRDDWFRIATTDSSWLLATPVAYMKVIGIQKGRTFQQGGT